MRRSTVPLIILALALSGAGYWVQKWSLDRYGLTLPTFLIAYLQGSVRGVKEALERRFGL